MTKKHGQSPAADHTTREVALVVGGSGDIGTAIVKRLSEAGWDVVFSFHRRSQIAYQLAGHTNARPVPAASLYPGSESLPVVLGAFVNCIGVNPIDEDVLHTPIEVFRSVIEINLVDAFRLAKLALPSLIEGRGTIVNISSIWGTRSIEGIVGYVASKHGLRGLTATLAREYGPMGVTCNEVCPGAIDSRMMRECAARDVGSDPARIEESVRAVAAQTPIRRLVTADEIAAMVAFLCSRACRGINGASIVVDGGLTA